MFINASLFLNQFTKFCLFFQTIYNIFNFSLGDPTQRRPELTCVSPTRSAQPSFIECDICHKMSKSVRDLGIHKRDNHSGIVKPKVQPGPMPSLTKTPSPVSHGNVQKTPVASPVLLPGQIPCPLC